ncbi:histidine phosphatase family protein [Azoarcus sp. KH32C]|uniref:histidine phosphatase family protein n=1 Tax=Azoarcus sp. KH32C TaxID=748247 RepID=UPI0002385DFD|nr:histidine phosphatase family protein [Azoarcus sp. KH32C]BAL27176.1 phosphoglycerate mutase [Azoarcus sp. KH32C]
MSTLVLMRHGQASFGEARYDSLSETGRAQARHTGAWLGERGDMPTAVWTGPRRRQADTAALVIAASGIGHSPVLAPLLEEFAEGEEVLAAAAELFGRPMTGPEAPPRTEQLRCYDAAYEAWSRNRVAIPGRAAFGVFRGGVRQWLREVVAVPDAPSGQRILAVTSSGVIAAVVCDVLGLGDEQWCALVRLIQNGSLTEVVFSRGRTGLRTFNSAGHLPRELVSTI